MEKGSVGNGAEHRKHVDIRTAGWGGTTKTTTGLSDPGIDSDT